MNGIYHQQRHFKQQRILMNHPIHTVTLAFTGASGLPYGMRLLECLLQSGKTVWLLYSQAAQIVAQQEMNLHLPASPSACQQFLCQHFQVSNQQLRVFGKDEWFAPCFRHQSCRCHDYLPCQHGRGGSHRSWHIRPSD